MDFRSTTLGADAMSYVAPNEYCLSKVDLAFGQDSVALLRLRSESLTGIGLHRTFTGSIKTYRDLRIPIPVAL